VPLLSDRSTREEWEKSGSLDTRERARQKVMSILEQPEKFYPSDDIREKIRSEIKGIRGEFI
jgi:trimethylamine:corrinoid methyltransferase-like protein